VLKAIDWNGGHPRILDQQVLPHDIRYEVSTSYQQTADAIRSMRIRGAPAIGVAAAYGIAQAALASTATSADALLADVEGACALLGATRPTAVNLTWSIERMWQIMARGSDDGVRRIRDALVDEALALAADDEAVCAAIGQAGASLVRDGHRIFTHCNTGALATAGIGTALGVIRVAHAEGKRIGVWVGETRPYWQGARLTALELREAGIPHTVVTDGTAALLMARGEVDMVLVGADRITTAGDVANKIGTYALAIMAKEHGVPFYVAAPLSTVDQRLRCGADIEIEERSADEVLLVHGKPIAPVGTRAAHFAFDVTPHRYLRGIITEIGILTPPFVDSLASAMLGAAQSL
jgi:methylthioribose-1-phosphate isomerase